MKNAGSDDGSNSKKLAGEVIIKKYGRSGAGLLTWHSSAARARASQVIGEPPGRDWASSRTALIFYQGWSPVRGRGWMHLTISIASRVHRRLWCFSQNTYFPEKFIFNLREQF